MGKRFLEIMNGFSDEIAKNLPVAAIDTFAKADSVINNPNVERVAVSISGGGDSDIMLDVLWRIDVDKKCRYVFFNTGIEYRATLEHLDDLEKKYGIEIKRIKPKKSIPVCCKEYGQPFLSKFVSSKLSALQKYGFQWEDESFEALVEKYPKCKDSLRWWTCTKNNALDITRNKWLKEFILQNPPTFKIASDCCNWAKKKPSHDFYKENNIDVMCVGVRKAEGGQRATAYKNCYSAKANGETQYRPLFWWFDKDCELYREALGIERSRCYTQYGFKRTGCSGCPYNQYVFEDMKSTIVYEPEMNKLANLVFKESYEYTRQYREFQKKMGYYVRKKEQKDDSD